MGELSTNVNWLAVGAGTVLSFILGWAWYSPMLFGNKWAAGNSVELASKDNSMPVFPLVLQLIATFAMAWLIAVTAANEALMTAILAILTIALMIAANGKFAQKPNTVVWIESIFIIVMGVVMIACQAVL